MCGGTGEEEKAGIIELKPENRKLLHADYEKFISDNCTNNNSADEFWQEKNDF